ncbi:transcriptional activator NhaR [Colwellia sp. MB02u-6]|uniref:transcriptional activator NhaR n=1 Tax=Colwellia sp. MB02u-6 TaxID=2759824 RepID=UPI0015F71829|nr:transcriptional activator NhaR [Colwellia sp. MB02u-6]MBA6328456.1 transcriptional activator NhaR [Colwellia sp. MB02u-6]
MAKLNYHHLQYFHAIATYGSIAQAAKVMHITPQTLSAQLNLLEEQLGYSLFERKGKRLVLNDMGRISFSYTQEIFSLGDELLHSLKNHSTDFSFRFSIGVTDVIAKVFSFNLLKSVYAMDNSIKLVCKETSLDVLLGELAMNKLDAVLSDTSLPTGSPLKAYSHLIGKCGLSFFADKKLAQSLKGDFPMSLDGRPFFTAGEGSNQHLNVLSWFNELDISPKIIGEFDDSVLTKYFGQAGYGIFCAPTMIENHVVEQFDVEIIGRTNDIIEHYYLISPERKVKHPAVQHLLTEGKKLFKNPMS